MWFLIGIATACGILAFVGSRMALTAYEREQNAARTKAETEARLHASLAATQAELDRARQHAADVDAREGRRATRFTQVARLIGEAINTGDGYRYALDTAIIQHSSRAAYQAFSDEFDSTDHARNIEHWRGETAAMLDRELPGLQLGAALSAIDGTRNAGRPGFRLSQLVNCMAYLRNLQANLPPIIAQIVH